MSIEKIKEAIEDIILYSELPNMLTANQHKQMIDGPTKLMIAIAEHLIEEDDKEW